MNIIELLTVLGTLPIAMWALKAGAIVLLALLAVRTLPTLSASVKFAALFYALTATLLLPLLASTLPAWQVLPNTTSSSLNAPIAITTPALSPSATFTVENASTSLVAPPTAIVSNGPAWSFSAGLMLAALWCAGIAVLSIRLARANGKLTALKHQAPVVTDTLWLRQLDELRQRMGVTRAVQLRLHPDPIMPMTFGWYAPVILLPLDATDWSSTRRRDVLLHELAHVQRHDLVYEWISTAVCVLQWFNPVLWWARRELNVERERACDDLVIAADTDPSRYANCLLETTVAYQATSLPGACMARPSDLESRLVAIHDSAQPRQRLSPSSRIAIGFLCAALLVPLSALALEMRAPAAPEPPEPIAAAQPVQPPSPPADVMPVVPERAPSAPPAPIAPRDVPAEDAALFLQYESDSQLFRDHADVDLSATGPEALAALINSLRSESPINRAAAAARLGDFDDPAAVQALLDAITDPDKHVREWSARSLGDISDPVAVTALSNALADPEPDVVEWSARALGDLQRPEAVDALVQALVHNSPDVREWSVRALGDIGGPRALDGLISTLQDSSSDVRQWAVRTLIDIGDPRGIAAVADLHNDPDAEVREWSQRADELVEWNTRDRDEDE